MQTNGKVAFSDEFERESFIEELSEAIPRDELRVQLQKIGESCLDASFTHKLKDQAE